MKTLSKLEQQIMQIVWSKDSCSVRDILEGLSKSRKIAYTTVATILQRLFDKDVVTRRPEGIRFVYSPKFSRQSYSKNLAQSFLKNFIKSYGDAAIVSFAESIETLPRNKKRYFLKLLEKYDKSK